MDSQFRSAAFGGFNRQDVMEYLERTSKEHNEALTQLRAQLEQAQKQLSEQDARQELLQGQVQRLTEARDAAVQETEREKKLRLNTEQKLQEKEASLAQREGEIHTLHGVVDQLRPNAEAYAAVKERTAGVELEAHRRAQAIQEKAENDARHLRRQMEQWMQRVTREYDGLRTEVETTVSHAALQLDKAGKALEQVNEILNEREVALESLAQAYAETDPARVAAPVPLDA